MLWTNYFTEVVESEESGKVKHSKNITKWDAWEVKLNFKRQSKGRVDKRLEAEKTLVSCGDTTVSQYQQQARDIMRLLQIILPAGYFFFQESYICIYTLCNYAFLQKRSIVRLMRSSSQYSHSHMSGSCSAHCCVNLIWVNLTFTFGWRWTSE